MSGESKQIDEDENGPENGGLKSGPCLIAGFHALSCTSPSYYNPYRGVNKNTLSVDMVRLSLTFKGDRGEWLSRKGAQLTDSGIDATGKTENQTCTRVDGCSAPSTLSLPVSRLDETCRIGRHIICR